MTDRLHSFTLGDVIRENSRWLPPMEAVVCGEDRLSYAEIDERTNRLANLLAGLGAGRGDRVAWLGLNCHRLLELFFACAKLGAIAAPLNWRLTAQEMTAVLEDIGPVVVIGSGRAEFEQTNVTARAALPSIPWLVYDEDSYEAQLATASSKDPEGDTDDELPVLQIMTAAFGGRPKAALLTSRGIVQQDLLLAAVGGIQPVEEVYLSSGPMFHIGVLLKTFALFHWGGRNVMVARADPEELCRLVEAERCTSAFVFGPTIQQMVEANVDGRYDLSSLVDTLGGAPPEAVADAWYQMTSCSPPGSYPRGAVGYGTSETVGMVTYEGRLPVGLGSFGRASPAMAIRIVDPDGVEVAPGEIGEIVVRGPQVMTGYLHAEPMDATGWRWTGDLGRREVDGSFSFLGPNQEMIKTGMENVYPVEVENALKQHPAVRDACVIGIPDAVWGQSVRAVVEVEGVAEPSADELIEFVKSRIAGYKKPKSVLVVESLPRSGPFVDRVAVKLQYGEGDTW